MVICIVKPEMFARYLSERLYKNIVNNNSQLFLKIDYKNTTYSAVSSS